LSVSLKNPARIVDRLRELQRQIRATLIAGRHSGDLARIDRISSADTIYNIDATIEPVIEQYLQNWAREQPFVLIAEGVEPESGRVYPDSAGEEDAEFRLIIDPIDGTRGLMYDKRAAWTLAGVAPNKGPTTRLRDIEVAVMTELPTSKMGFSDVLWAIKGQGAHGLRERLDGKAAMLEPPEQELMGKPIGQVLTKMGKVADEHLIEALNAQKTTGGLFGQLLVGLGHVNENDVQIALAFQKGKEPRLDPKLMSVIVGDVLPLRPSQAESIDHGFAMIVNFLPGTKVLASELMEYLVQNLLGEPHHASVFDDQYISTGGQFYEMIVGHDRFNADLRPVFHRMQKTVMGLCCHPYDCATMLIAEEAGVVLTDETGQPLDGPLDTITPIAWIAYANDTLRQRIEPLVHKFLRLKQG
jgi:fructose-1,6-bisphosphatase/inositol monophosphatase family enzyme